MSIGQLVATGPLLLALPVAATAGAVTFLSPCCLPLVPGYLSFITGMTGASTGSGADSNAGGSANSSAGGSAGRAAAASSASASGGGVAVAALPVAPAVTPVATRGRVVLATLLFVLGFSAVFASEGAVVGGIGDLLAGQTQLVTRVLGAFTILLGLMFAGAFDRFSFAGRVFKPSVRPKAGMAGAPLLGVMFGIGWSPCMGPTLGAVFGLAATGGAARGSTIAFVYALGLGVPFLLVAFGFQQATRAFAFARRHTRGIMIAGGILLVCVGILEVSGAWLTFMGWLKVHWPGGYSTYL